MSLNGVIREIIDGMVEMSGLVLFRVTGTWANKGRTGEVDSIVMARDAIEAIKRAWEPEDDRDLRTIHAEWLCPVESVQKWNDYRCKLCDGPLDDDGTDEKCHHCCGGS